MAVKANLSLNSLVAPIGNIKSQEVTQVIDQILKRTTVLVTRVP